MAFYFQTTINQAKCVRVSAVLCATFQGKEWKLYALLKTMTKVPRGQVATLYVVMCFNDTSIYVGSLIAHQPAHTGSIERVPTDLLYTYSSSSIDFWESSLNNHSLIEINPRQSFHFFHPFFLSFFSQRWHVNQTSLVQSTAQDVDLNSYRWFLDIWQKSLFMIGSNVMEKKTRYARRHLEAL